MVDPCTFAAIFAALYAGHHVGDIITGQTDWQAANKAGHGWTAVRAMGGHLLGYHLTLAAFLASLLLIGIPITWLGAIAALAFSALTHGILDRRWPVKWLLEHTGSGPFSRLADYGINGMYIADQACHTGCLFVAALLAVAVGNG